MKKTFKYIFLLILLILTLITPSIITKGAKDGLTLWLYALIPALFPYMIISNMIIKSGIAIEMALITKPIAKLLKLPQSAAYCIFSGLFFGYPACAVNANLMVQEGQLDKNSACFCTCAFNNISPAFIVGFLCLGILGDTAFTAPVLIIFYISLLLSTILIRILFFRKMSSEYIPEKPTIYSNRNIISDSIKSALISIGLLGGYVIIFSIINSYLLLLQHSHYISPFLEISGGISVAYQFSTKAKIMPIIMSALSFGGLSGIFQTFGVDSCGFIDKKKYIYSKVIAGITGFTVTLVAVYVLKVFN